MTTTTSRVAWVTSLAVLIAALGANSFAQAPFPAGRPLSGSIVCRIQTTSGTAFTETQTHTWTFTGAAPQVSNGDLWIHPAQWSVTGTGKRNQQSPTFIQNEDWALAGGPIDAPIALRSNGTNLTIELYHSPAQVSDGITGATQSFGGGFSSNPFPWKEPAREAPLPPMQSPRTAASLSGSASATITGQFPVHRQPAGTDVVESCTWQIAPAGTAGTLPPSPSVTPADGPWSGQAQCVLTATGPNYQDEQTHTWRLTGEAPTISGIFRQWPAMWSVKGKGSRQTGVASGRARVADLAIPTITESWTIEVPETKAPIAIWQLAANGSRIRIGSQHGILVAYKAFNLRTKTANGAETQSSATIDEWLFPVTEDDASLTTIKGTYTRPAAAGARRGWRQPAEVVTTETCNWEFTRGGSSTSPELSSRRDTRPAVVAAGGAPVVSPRDKVAIGESTGGGAAILSTVQCTTAGPQATTTVTPGGVTFKWPALQGASGYSISRRDVGVLTASPITALTYTHAAPLDYHNAPYQYTITASYPDGRCATGTVSVTAPRPITPTVTPTVVADAKAKVTLKWPAQSDTPSTYVVLGPGVHQNGAEVTAAASGQTFEIDNVPAGPQTWLVIPVWKTPAGNMSDASLAARVTATITFTTGNYRISMAGFRVNHPTYDDQLSLDGQGDEVYAAATVSQWRRQLNSVLVSNDTVKSEVYRGLNTGGVAPSGFNPSQAPGGAGSKTRFPLTLWEGTLKNGIDVVVVHPSLWELDGDNTVFERWKGNTSGGAASNYFWFKDMASGTLFEHKNDFPTDIYQFATAAQFANEQEPFSSNSTRPQRIYPGRDRPIGLDYYSQDVVLELFNYSKIYWVDREYTFTREKIEALLTAPASGLAPGMFAVPFVDGDPHHAAGRLDGDYTLYFYVQRIP